MHEVSLVHALFDQADAAVAAYPRAAVRQVRVRIGALAGVEPELFRSAFEGSRCERGYSAAELALVLDASDDLVLERIELEVSDV